MCVPDKEDLKDFWKKNVSSKILLSSSDNIFVLVKLATPLHCKTARTILKNKFGKNFCLENNFI